MSDLPLSSGHFSGERRGSDGSQSPARVGDFVTAQLGSERFALVPIRRFRVWCFVLGAVLVVCWVGCVLLFLLIWNSDEELSRPGATPLCVTDPCSGVLIFLTPLNGAIQETPYIVVARVDVLDPDKQAMV